MHNSHAPRLIQRFLSIVRPSTLAMLLGVACAVAVAFGLYLPALNGPLLLDDVHVIGPLLEPGALERGWLQYLFNDSGPLGRPLAMLTFIANSAVHGDALWSWKATNLAIHATVALAIYALFNKIFCVCGAAPDRARVVALLGALMWLVHPLHVSTVMYTVQRMTQLATLFSVIGMYAYVSGRVACAQGRSGGLAIVSAFFLFMPLAAFSKESGLLLPLYLACLELTIFTDPQWPRPRWLVWVFMVGLILPYGAGAAYILSDIQARLLSGYVMRDFGPGERLLTQARALVTYAGWIVVPRRTGLGFYHDDMRVSHALFDEPDTLAATAAIIVTLALAWSMRRRARLAVLGIAIFFAGHALESTIFGLDLMYEHRNYLPALGIILIACWAALKLENRRLLIIAGALFVAVFTGATALRTQAWGDEGQLYHALVQARPNSVRARVSLAEWHTVRGEFQTALATLDGMDDLTGRIHRLRVLCARDGRAGDGAEDLLGAIADAPHPSNFAVDTLILLSGKAVDGECAVDTAQLITALEAVSTRPLPTARRYRAYVYAAILRHRLGATEAALALLSRAAASTPADPFPWYLSAEWAAEAGNIDAAREFLDEARRRAHHASRDYAPMDAAVADLINVP